MRKMKKIRTLNHWLAVVLSFTLMMCISCDDDDDDGPGTPQPTGNSETYQLGAVSNPGITGTVKFEELDNGNIRVTINLNNTTSGGSHPSHIHFNSAAESGTIAISLTNVDGATGSSVTEVNEMDNGTAINYNELINFDGYVNVHLSASDLDILIAQGDIGGNELTGETLEIDLDEKDVADISGTATFAKRKNGLTLLTIELQNTPPGGSHPAHIHMNSAAEGGGIVISLNAIDGDTGLSKTTIRETDAGDPVTYEEVVVYNGYVNVHLSDMDLGTIVAQGDILEGNRLEGSTETYDLLEVGGSGVSGTATFAKRNDGYTIITVELTGTSGGASHPMHIHDNDAATTGPIAVSLTNVNGDTGKSITLVTEKDDATDITYDQLITYNGYINVHLSASQLSTIVAQGDIGSNAD
ncbi:CHRD domain-containing protein [Rapidithrix thailandica]|uniref:CHRD domain-containing protein n=1 Tax=Rapidithrix thailandica TaxID=413964 RepID=A0AAW9SES7_9BACT